MKNRHLSTEDRLIIESGLKEGLSFKSIALQIGKDPTTVSKEVKLHRYEKQRNLSYTPNICQYRTSCVKSEHCHRKGCDITKCRKCVKCNDYCKDFKKLVCDRLSRAPLVCNGCKDYQFCRLDKYLYDARRADMHYEFTLSDSRTGINMSESDFVELDNLVSPLVKKGQSVSSILINHGDEIVVSDRTLYRYVDKNLFSVRNIDLPRKVRYKKRKARKDKKSQKDNPIRKKGREYSDFVEYVNTNTRVHVAQMDTVEGRKGVRQKCLLTLQLPDQRLLLSYIMDSQTVDCVKTVLDSIELNLGKELFNTMFPVILTDNGSEFKNPELIEQSVFGGRRTMVFFCDPYSSFQKGEIENNHEMIRRIIPKGVSMNCYTQKEIGLMTDHINSYARKSLDGLTPYQAAYRNFGRLAMAKLGLHRIEPDSVTLKPSLLENITTPKDIEKENISKRLAKKRKLV